ncbi:unnamed protein product [Allacma fusca]|uniref:Uncharacterized protein n=1 Tax=Allacma fusca TaxID=39272 RepID=A0A8J2PJ05_9HEXA|nr:unnamed protein product [Allacma fusca]
MTMPEENNFWGIRPEFRTQPQSRRGAMSTAKSILPINNNDDYLQEVFLEFGGRGSKKREKKVEAEENINVWENPWGVGRTGALKLIRRSIEVLGLSWRCLALILNRYPEFLRNYDTLLSNSAKPWRQIEITERVRRF